MDDCTRGSAGLRALVVAVLSAALPVGGRPVMAAVDLARFVVIRPVDAYLQCSGPLGPRSDTEALALFGPGTDPEAVESGSPVHAATPGGVVKGVVGQVVVDCPAAPRHRRVPVARVRWETPVPWPPGVFGSITAMLGVTGPAPAPAALGRVQWGASGPRVEACLAAIRKPFSSWHRVDPYQPGQSAAIVTLPGGRQYVHLWAREYDWPGLPRDKASTVMGYLCAETPAGPQVIASGQFFSFDGVADLDGDGVYEVLARGRPAGGGHLRLFDGTRLSDPKRLLE